ncbi:hypothetical protein DdX_11132 [Ditylenchus destructor]|uniref:Uncharacterized protein n=1 Tax=Ditylenchus destructor TaxID=166010 RepID=A0AAD4MYQ2_9BILA|nr:hypothetical protein DdX_11132 [Ditylenchus destructor]
MASGNPENPGFGQVTDQPSRLLSGRMIRQSLPLGELNRLVPVSVPANQPIRRYGFRKSGKSWIWAGHRSAVAPPFWAYDTSIASSRRAESIGTGLSSGKSADPEIWLPEILDDQGRRHAAKPLGSPMELSLLTRRVGSFIRARTNII